MTDNFYNFYNNEKARIDRERSLVAVDFQQYQIGMLKELINAYCPKSDGLEKYYDYEVADSEEDNSLFRRFLNRLSLFK